MAGREPEMVGDGIARFFPFGYPTERTAYSFALEREPSPRGEVPAGYRVRVAFSREEGGAEGGFRHAGVVPITPGTTLYGAGDVSGPLLRNGRRAGGGGGVGAASERVWPWVLAVRPDGTAFGVLADTTYPCEVDLTTGIRFIADGPEEGFPVVVIDRDSPQEVLQGLAGLAGLPALPPRWVLGYQQIAPATATSADVRALAAGFRRRGLACDAIWMGAIGASDDAAKLHEELHAAGFHVVRAIDTRVRVGDALFQEGEAGDHWVRPATTDAYRLPDFTRPETRAWWAGIHRDRSARGADGVWLEAPRWPRGEYRGGGALAAGTGARYGGVYGLLALDATAEGMRQGAQRAVVALEPTSVGGQRYGTAWVRETAVSWSSLEESLPRLLNLGLSGQALTGWRVDAAGGDEDAYARWLGVAMMMPMVSAGAEPWGAGAKVEQVFKAATERRRRLTPYMYSVAREASLTGLPVARPVYFADARDAALRSEDDAFLLGGDVLIVADVKERGGRAVVRPRGIWNELATGAAGEKEPELPRLYVRGGAIVPLGAAQTGNEAESLELVVSLDEAGRAEGFLYEDGGDGIGYRANEYLWTRYLAEIRDGVVTVRLASSEGGMRRPERALNVRLIVTNSEKLPATTVRAGEYRAAGKEGVNVVIDVRAVR